MRGTAIGTAKRQSTIRAMTNGTKCNTVDRHGKHILIAFWCVKIGKSGERKHGEHQDSHAGAEVATVDRDGELRGDLPRCVARLAIGSVLQQRADGKQQRRKK